MEFLYHRSLEHLHVGCEKPCAYLIPYQNFDVAKNSDRTKSNRFYSLCGEWKFHYFKSETEIPDFTSPNWNSENADCITVPMSWQYAFGRGYDVPQYLDVDYPFMVAPPHVPRQNPCGLYERDFWIDETTYGTFDIRLIFEGVDSCFYAFVNNQFVAYSQISHSTTEIRIGDFVHAGKNTLKVLVFKWCDGSYLEDQDKIRCSGIFREVYLLFRDKIHVRDIFVRTEVSKDLMSANVKAEIKFSGSAMLSYRLISPDGVIIRNGVVSGNRFVRIEVPVDAPALWSDECPKLYALELLSGTEHIRQEVGIRRIEICNKVLYLNGKAIKGKGVNRHDSHPRLGAATPFEHMLRDLFILKAHNVNMIRTSHYPNDPRFPELCDRLGFYLCDEADLESHGMIKFRTWDELTNHPDWRQAYLDRAEHLMERDKNHACVLMWSVGNEMGIGKNQCAMADWFHTRYPGCVVHCEDLSRRTARHQLEHNNSLESDGNPEWYRTKYVDIDSRMYLPIPDCVKDYLENENQDKPLFLAEYSHAMGNSCGDLGAYWDTIFQYESFFGACVWEMSDHAVDVGEAGNPKYLYGGDLGTFPSNGNYCIDGLLYPDRRPHSSMLELKQVLRPCRAVKWDADKNAVTLKNMRYFADLSDIDLFWNIERNGVSVRQGRFLNLKIQPQEEMQYIIPFKQMEPAEGFCYLNLSFRQARDTQWEKRGYEVGFEQFELSVPKKSGSRPESERKPVSVKETKRSFLITDGAFRYTVDRTTGLLTSLIGNDAEFLDTPILPNIYRAPIDNDRNALVEWKKKFFHCMSADCTACHFVRNAEDSVSVFADLFFGAPSHRPLLTIRAEYRFVGGEGVTIRMDSDLLLEKTFLPRYGLQFNMPSGFEKMTYFGYGPTEAYEDKRQATRMGVYSTSVSDHFEHYVKPQENMAHFGTKWLMIGNGAGTSLLMLATSGNPAFSFNCSHFTPLQLAESAHDFELVPLAQTVVNLDARQSGIGSNSCGPELDEAYRIQSPKLSFEIRLLPVMSGEVNPFEEIE